MAENEEKKATPEEEKKEDPNQELKDEIEELKSIFRTVRKWALYFLAPTTAVLVFFWLSPWTLHDKIKNYIMLVWRPALLIWWLTYAFRIVKEYENMLVQFVGKYIHTFKAGPRFILWPFMTGRFVKMWEQVEDIPPDEVITKDNVRLKVDGLVYFQRYDAYAAIFNIANLVSALGNLAQTNLRNEFGKITFDEVLISRQTINANLRQVLNDATDRGVIRDLEGNEIKEGDQSSEEILRRRTKQKFFKRIIIAPVKGMKKIGEKIKGKQKGWGTKVKRVEIRRVEPLDEKFIEAMALQASAEREKRAMVTRAEGEKEATILISEGEREKEINLGEGLKKKFEQILEALKENPKTPELIKIMALDAQKAIADGQATKIYLPTELAGIPQIAELFNLKTKQEA